MKGRKGEEGRDEDQRTLEKKGHVSGLSTPHDVGSITSGDFRRKKRAKRRVRAEVKSSGKKDKRKKLKQAGIRDKESCEDTASHIHQHVSLLERG